MDMKIRQGRIVGFESLVMVAGNGKVMPRSLWNFGLSFE